MKLRLDVTKAEKELIESLLTVHRQREEHTSSPAGRLLIKFRAAWANAASKTSDRQ